MPCTINASITSTGLIHSADATGVLNLQTNGSNALTVNANANVTVNNSLFVSGNSVQPLVLGTPQTVTSGTNVDYTGIPSWVRRITVTVTGLSFAAAGTMVVQIGSGSLTTSGYTLSLQTVTNAATPSVTTPSTYLGVFATATAAGIVSGQTVLVLQDPTTNTWVSQGIAIRQADNIIQTWSGFISLAGTLDRIGLVAVVSTYDAGKVNIMYE